AAGGGRGVEVGGPAHHLDRASIEAAREAHRSAGSLDGARAGDRAGGIERMGSATEVEDRARRHVVVPGGRSTSRELERGGLRLDDTTSLVVHDDLEFTGRAAGRFLQQT